jgi:hypothetical protein
MDNKGKFVGFVKLRHRIAQKKNGLSNGWYNINWSIKYQYPNFWL